MLPIILAEAIEEAGADLGYCWYGARALMSMRLEKSWGVWTLDFRPDFDAAESGLDTFINWKKDFVGKAATEDARNALPQRKLVTLVIEVDGIDVSGDEAVLLADEAVGYVSSGGYGHRVGQSLAMAYVSSAAAQAGQTLAVEILGESYSAQVVAEALYDPSGERMRG